MASQSENHFSPLLGLNTPPSLRDEDFIRSDCNRVAYHHVLVEKNWPEGRLIVTGPAKSGKTHLVKIWARQTNALIMNCNDLACESKVAAAREGQATVVLHANNVAGHPSKEIALFHMCNHVATRPGHQLLLLARQSPVKWSIELADLASRLQGSRIAAIAAPDDQLMAALLTKLFADRQISVRKNIINFILPRMERSFNSAQKLVAEMDRRGMSTGRQITLSIAAASLASVTKSND